MTEQRGRISILPPEETTGSAATETEAAGGGIGVHTAIKTDDSGEGGEKGPGGPFFGEAQEEFFRNPAPFLFVTLWLSKQTFVPDDAPDSVIEERVADAERFEEDLREVLESSFLTEPARNFVVNSVGTEFSSGVACPDDLIPLEELGIDYEAFRKYINAIRANPGSSVLEGVFLGRDVSLDPIKALEEVRRTLSASRENGGQEERINAGPPLGIFEEGDHLRKVEEGLFRRDAEERSRVFGSLAMEEGIIKNHFDDWKKEIGERYPPAVLSDSS